MNHQVGRVSQQRLFPTRREVLELVKLNNQAWIWDEVDQIIPPRFPARRNTLCVDLAQSILDVTFVDVSRYHGENLLRK
jgi:hypothetical protein